MPNSPNYTMVKRQQRFTLDGSLSARVIVLRGEGATPRQVHGTLENSSIGGVRLHLDDCVPYGETATLRIVFEDAVGNQDGELELEITVCWSRPSDDGKWTTGCDCVTDLSEDVFAMFADRGQIERRRVARRPTWLVAMARWELSLDERPIEITDASQTGFWFRSAKIGSMGDRMLVRLTTIQGEEVTVAAELRWIAKTDSGYLGGCSLVDEADHRHLMPFAVEDKPDNTPRRATSVDKRVRRGPNLAFAATVFLMFMGPSVIVLPLLRANRSVRAIPIAEDQPHEEMAEIRLAQVESDSLRFNEPAEPDATRTESHTESTTIDGPSADATPIDETPIAETPIDETPIVDTATFIPLVENTTPVEPRDEPIANTPAVDTPTDNISVVDIPVEVAPDASNLGETFRSAVVPDEVRVPDAEIVTLEEASDDSPTLSPTPVGPTTIEVPPSVESFAVESFAVESLAVESVAIEPVAIELAVPESSVPDSRIPEPVAVEAVAPESVPPEPEIIEPFRPEPDSPADVVPDAFAPEPVAIEPIVDETVIPAPVITAPIVAPRVITPATRRQAAAEFGRGREALAAGDTSGALTAFAAATASNPDVALYQYHWALALHLADQTEAAIVRVAEAARVEHEHGIANWGRVMQRIQGRPRVWLERERRQALADG